MVWCENCDCEMQKTKLSIEVKISPYAAAIGDRYICEKCGHTVISDFGSPYNPQRDD